MTTTKLISIDQAADRGILRLRKPKWVHPMDHILIGTIMGTPTPWADLYCPMNKECNGRDPVRLLTQCTSETSWEPYDGPLPDSDEYKAAQAQFDGVLRSTFSSNARRP